MLRANRFARRARGRDARRRGGYYQLATVENPDLDVPFALSAWGALQKCDSVDTGGRPRVPGPRALTAELLSAR
jgi:hypothetical protein